MKQKIYQILSTLSLVFQISSTCGFATDNRDEEDIIVSPIPGTISRLHVRERDFFREGDPLIEIEAMKMTLLIRACRDGYVSRLQVREGGHVQCRQNLFFFSPELQSIQEEALLTAHNIFPKLLVSEIEGVDEHPIQDSTQEKVPMQLLDGISEKLSIDPDTLIELSDISGVSNAIFSTAFIKGEQSSSQFDDQDIKNLSEAKSSDFHSPLFNTSYPLTEQLEEPAERTMCIDSQTSSIKQDGQEEISANSPEFQVMHLSIMSGHNAQHRLQEQTTELFLPSFSRGIQIEASHQNLNSLEQTIKHQVFITNVLEMLMKVANDQREILLNQRPTDVFLQKITIYNPIMSLQGFITETTKNHKEIQSINFLNKNIHKHQKLNNLQIKTNTFRQTYNSSQQVKHYVSQAGSLTALAFSGWLVQNISMIGFTAPTVNGWQRKRRKMDLQHNIMRI